MIRCFFTDRLLLLLCSLLLILMSILRFDQHRYLNSHSQDFKRFSFYTTMLVILCIIIIIYCLLPLFNLLNLVSSSSYLLPYIPSFESLQKYALAQHLSLQFPKCIFLLRIKSNNVYRLHHITSYSSCFYSNNLYVLDQPAYGMQLILGCN